MGASDSDDETRLSELAKRMLAMPHKPQKEMKLGKIAAYKPLKKPTKKGAKPSQKY